MKNHATTGENRKTENELCETSGLDNGGPGGYNALVPNGKESTMQSPQIAASLHGTALSDLLEQKSEARLALIDALKKMEQAAPHGRDYSPENYDMARTLHYDRVKAVEAIINGYMAELMELSDMLPD